jgi:Transposase IS116/IS110/IS902 family
VCRRGVRSWSGGCWGYQGADASEDSTGERRRLGAITKTGNTHARRLLVEPAWHQRRPLRASATLERRRQGQPALVRARADQNARRLAPHASTTAGALPTDRKGPQTRAFQPYALDKTQSISAVLPKEVVSAADRRRAAERPVRSALVVVAQRNSPGRGAALAPTRP